MSNKEIEKNKVFLRTYGCQMNDRDSEVVKGLLLAQGYELTEDVNSADIVLFNTCSVRQHAEEKVWSAIGKFKTRSTRNSTTRKLVIGIIGCMAQNYKEEIFKRAPSVDIVCGPSCIDELPKMIDAVTKSPSHQVTSRKSKEKNAMRIEERMRKESIYHTGFHEEKNHAYVVISGGCDNFCSYCVVPYVRGRLRHRPADEIIKEVKAAVGAGIENITLLGQNVNSYRSAYSVERRADRETTFVDLLQEIAKIKELKSLSFLTSHPKDTTKELFELMRDLPMIKKNLHLPVQSGSDRILKLMNRGYTHEKYLQIVDQYRSIVYNGKISTDIIIGYPTETKDDFRQTLDLVKRVGFDSAYIFKYSARPHTKAALLEDDVPKLEKEKRHAELLKLQKDISKKRRKSED